MSIKKKADRWYVYARYKDWTGATRQHKKEGFSRRADAVAYERQFLEKQNGSPDMTLGTLYRLYMEDCKLRLKPTTYHIKEKVFIRHVLPYFAQKRGQYHERRI